VARNQKRDAKRPAHDSVLALGSLTKPQRQVANSLRAAFNSQRLVVVESVVLALDSRVLDHTAGVGLQAAHRAADMTVYFDYLFDTRGFEEGGGDTLFNAEDYAFCCRDLKVVRDVHGRRDGFFLTPMAVDPSLMASREYSTWKRRPSGEKVLFKISRKAWLVGKHVFLLDTTIWVEKSR
jgi:hypothetical protein